MAALLNKREEARALRLARSQPRLGKQFAAFVEGLKQRATDLVLNDSRVRDRLATHRYAVVATDYREDTPAGGKEEGLRWAEVSIYDYNRDVMVVAIIDLREGAVADLTERTGAQPPIASEELEAARKIASTHARMGALLRRRTEVRVVAFPTPRYRVSQERGRHRCATLYLPPQGNRAGPPEITVDLSLGQLVPDAELREAAARLPR